MLNPDFRDMLSEFNAAGVEYLIDLLNPDVLAQIGIEPHRIDILSAIDGV